MHSIAMVSHTAARVLHLFQGSLVKRAGKAGGAESQAVKRRES